MNNKVQHSNMFLIKLIFFCFYNVFFSRDEINWDQIYHSDIQYIIDTLKKNHPRYYDPINPDFKKKLDRVNTGRITEPVGSYTDYIYALRKFLNTFQDSYLNISFKKNDLP